MLKIQLYLKVLAVFLLFLQVHSNGMCSKDLDRTCGAYCYQVVKVLLANAASAQSKENQFAELRSKIIELEGVIKFNDAQLEKQMELNGWLKDTITTKDELLNTLKNDKIVNLQQDIILLKNTINEKNNIIKEKEAEISLITTQIVDKDNQITKLNKQIHENDIILRDKDDQIAKLQMKIASKVNDIKNNIFQVKDRVYQISFNKDDECKSEPVASSCLGKSTDVHPIQVSGMGIVQVRCDSSLAGPGWTVIQRRIDGSVSFNRNWTEYKNGFGNLKGEFFIGLEMLHLLTKSEPHELYIYLTDFQNVSRDALYGHFVIGNEDDLYRLKSVGDYSGIAGDALIHHLNYPFSTADRDNDLAASNCAENFQSGWWFNKCYSCNLNGVYGGENATYRKITWNTWNKPLKHVQMMIRPVF